MHALGGAFFRPRSAVEDQPMVLLYVALALVFLALTWVLLELCDRLSGGTKWIICTWLWDWSPWRCSSAR